MEQLRKQLAEKDIEIGKLKDEIAENSFVPVRAAPPGSRLQQKVIDVKALAQVAQGEEGTAQEDQKEETSVEDFAKPPQGTSPMGEINFAAQIAAMKAKK